MAALAPAAAAAALAAAPAARPEMDIPANRFNNPHPANPIETLKGIGPLFAGRFRQRGIDTLQDYLDYILRHRQPTNRALFRAVLINQRWPNPANRCVGQRVHNNGNVYSVNQYNYYAWESLVRYARNQLAADPRRRYRRRPGDHRWTYRVPDLLAKRQPNQAFPDTCQRINPAAAAPAAAPAAGPDSDDENDDDDEEDE